MMSTRIRLVVALALGFWLTALAGCEKQTPEAEPVAQEPNPAEGEVEEAPAEEPGAEPDMDPHSSAMPGTMNQLEWDQDVPEVTLAVPTPAEGATIEAGESVEVTFDLKNYRTGKRIGQHAHVIVDNEPYIAHYNTKEPLVLEDLEPGTHTLRIFPARHYHLSLKKGRPFVTRTFHVGEASADFAFDPAKPFITYSRPKGSYPKDVADQILLDFYISNVELGKDAKVVYGVDGEETELTEWKPVLLPPLGSGDHEITLELVDMEGNLIENAGYNNTTRTITIE